MIEFDIGEEFKAQVMTNHFEKAAAQVLALTNQHPESEIGLQVTDNAVLQQFNLQYMRIDAPTDVLSFPVPFENPDTGRPYLGDILISYPMAVQQAETSGHTPEEELTLLFVHGILHLLGYDHSTPEEKEVMWSIQDKILNSLEIKARPAE